MASIPQHKNLESNPYDNADLTMGSDFRDVAQAAQGGFDYIKAEKEYLDWMMKRDQFLKTSDGGISTIIRKEDGTPEAVKIPPGDILAPLSEFESVRLYVTRKVNKLPAANLKKYFAMYETDSPFELSSKITNWLMAEKRKKDVNTAFGQAMEFKV